MARAGKKALEQRIARWGVNERWAEYYYVNSEEAVHVPHCESRHSGYWSSPGDGRWAEQVVEKMMDTAYWSAAQIVKASRCQIDLLQANHCQRKGRGLTSGRIAKACAWVARHRRPYSTQTMNDMSLNRYRAMRRPNYDASL